jgi:hypothetical protein
MKDELESEAIIRSVTRWVERVVVGLNLCPFAKAPMANGAIRYSVATVDSSEALLEELLSELIYLDEHPHTETTLLIHPQVLNDFYDYNAFLALADQLLIGVDREGVYQVASFHPCYQFADTLPEDAENYSNRSPYPMLHLLREESVASAVDAHPNPRNIPLRNVEFLTGLGSKQLAGLLSGCVFEEDS